MESTTGVRPGEPVARWCQMPEDVWNRSRSGSEEAVDTSGRGIRGDQLFPQMVLSTVWFSKILVGVLRRQTQRKEGRRRHRESLLSKKIGKCKMGLVTKFKMLVGLLTMCGGCGVAAASSAGTPGVQKPVRSCCKSGRGQGQGAG